MFYSEVFLLQEKIPAGQGVVFNWSLKVTINSDTALFFILRPNVLPDVTTLSVVLSSCVWVWCLILRCCWFPSPCGSHSLSSTNTFWCTVTKVLSIPLPTSHPGSTNTVLWLQNSCTRGTVLLGFQYTESQRVLAVWKTFVFNSDPQISDDNSKLTCLVFNI